MALNFPNSPSLNDTHTHNGLTWVWNGSVWEMQGSGGASVTVSDNAPSSPTHGDMWWESDTGDLKIYYDESETGAGSGAFWVSANGADSMVGISTSAPTNPQTGDLWWDSDVAALYMYYNDGNSSQWVSAASGATGAQGAAGAAGAAGAQGAAGAVGAQGAAGAQGATGSFNSNTDATIANLTVTGNASIAGVLTYEDVTNVDAIGIVTARAGVKVPDSQKIFLGTGDDLQIYHDGSWNYIQSHNSKNFVIQVNDNENAFVAIPDGEVQLYHNNVKKLETTSSGVKVSGSFPDFIIHDTDTTNDNFRILHNSGGTQLQVDPNNVSSGSYLLAAIDGTERLRIDSSGDATFKYKVNIGDSYAGGEIFKLGKSSGTSYLAHYNGGTAHGFIGHADQLVSGGASDDYALRATNDLVFATNGNNERLRITSDGILSGGSAASTGGSTLIENRYSDPHVLNILGSMYSTGNTTLTYGLRPKSGGSGYVSSYANFSGRRAALQIGQGTFEFYTTSGSSATAVGTDIGTTRNMLLNHDGKLELRYDNSGGVGAYLSLQNRGTATGTRTGISFAVGASDAILNATDYGEAEIHVHRDSGGHGNFDFRCHTGANRSWLKIIGNGQNQQGAGSGTEGMRGGVAFGCAGIAIDRSWMGQPGIHVFNQNVEGDTDQGTFRFHGWNRSYASYPGSSGSDFGVSLVADGMTLTSDRRRKTGITTITGALDTVSQMRGVSFTYLNQDLEPQTHMSMSNGRKLGFIAQEVIPLLPELILDSGEKAVELENGYCDRYNMDYGGVAPLLVEAIKELKAQNESLQARIASLEGS